MNQLRAVRPRPRLVIALLACAAAIAVAPSAHADCPLNEPCPTDPKFADVSIQASASPNPATLGGALSLIFTVANSGDAATDSRVRVPVPSGAQLASAQSTQGTCQLGPPVICRVGTLTDEATATVTVVVVPGSAGTVTATGSISSAVTDTNTADNQAAVTVGVNAPAGVVAADLQLSSSDEPDPVAEGDPLRHTLTVHNAGPSMAAGVSLRDELPAPAEFSSAVPSQGSCSGRAIVSCTLGSLASGATATVVVTWIPAETGLLTSWVTAKSLLADPTPANSAVAETTTVVAAPPRDLRATGMEITQGVQRTQLLPNFGVPMPYDGVKLVGQTATVVRVFANREGGSSRPTRGVPARLSGFLQLPGGEVPLGAPLSPTSGPQDLGRGANSVTWAERARDDGGYAFLLPSAWTQPGRKIKLRAVVNPSAALDAVPECGGCGANNTIEQFNLEFEGSPSITVSPVRITFTDASGVFRSPPPSAGVFGDIRAMVPVGLGSMSIRNYVGSIDVTDLVSDPSLTASDLRDRVFQRVAAFEISNQPGFTIGIAAGLFRGLAAPVVYFPGRVEAIAIADSTRPIGSVGHELMHQFGYQHAGRHPACGALAGGPTVSWPPDDRGYLQGVGLDRRFGSGSTPGTFKVKAPGWPSASSQWYDLMSYCGTDDTSWISTVNWQTFGNVLPNGLPAFSPESGGERPQRTLRVMASRDQAGTVKILRVEPGFGQPTSRADADADAAYRLDVRDAGGGLVFSSALGSGEGHAHEDGDFTILTAEVPADGAERIELVADGEPAAVRERSATAPRVGRPRIELAESEVTVRWAAADADDDRLDASVEYSTDDGATWRLLTTGVQGSSVSLPAALLHAAEQARVRVTVNDGFNEAVAASEPFAAPGDGPSVHILDPQPGASLFVGGNLNLAGEALDDAGARIDPARLAWYDGEEPLGTGAVITVADLEPGPHQLRLIAQDERRRSAEAMVSITVVEGDR